MQRRSKMKFQGVIDFGVSNDFQRVYAMLGFYRRNGSISEPGTPYKCADGVLRHHIIQIWDIYIGLLENVYSSIYTLEWFESSQHSDHVCLSTRRRCSVLLCACIIISCPCSFRILLNTVVVPVSFLVIGCISSHGANLNICGWYSISIYVLKSTYLLRSIGFSMSFLCSGNIHR